MNNFDEITALAVYRNTSDQGIWRVESRINYTGEVSFEHDWDDVPSEYGTYATFYRLPNLMEFNELFNSIRR